ncbi:MAG: hypothetical protein ABMA25_11505 [Ilumatobacteraceae bacterium]
MSIETTEITVRFVSTGEIAWSTNTLAEYLDGVGDLFRGARAIAAELSSDGQPFTSDAWLNFDSVRFTGKAAVRERAQGPSIISLSVGSIDLAISLAGTAASAAGVVMVLRSAIANGPEWIENWATLRGRIKLENATNSARLREIADKVDRRDDLAAEDRVVLFELLDGDEQQQRDLARLQFSVERAAGTLRRYTPDVEVFSETETDD